MKITKVEHHSVDWHYKYEIDEEKLAEIYPDLAEEAIAQLLTNLASGDAAISDVINDAWENSVEIEWEFEYDDVWTDSKGGYEVTFDVEK
jgi:hypothetical protein